jgi:hypothetical protein
MPRRAQLRGRRLRGRQINTVLSTVFISVRESHHASQQRHAGQTLQERCKSVVDRIGADFSGSKIPSMVSRAKPCVSPQHAAICPSMSRWRRTPSAWPRSRSSISGWQVASPDSPLQSANRRLSKPPCQVMLIRPASGIKPEARNQLCQFAATPLCAHFYSDNPYYVTI